jgi:hypothetical protein
VVQIHENVAKNNGPPVYVVIDMPVAGPVIDCYADDTAVPLCGVLDLLSPGWSIEQTVRDFGFNISELMDAVEENAKSKMQVLPRKEITREGDCKLKYRKHTDSLEHQ